MVPVVHIVGMPSTKAQAHGAVLHHTLGNGDFRVFQKMFAAVTITNASLTQENAANEIDRVLKACVLGIRPGILLFIIVAKDSTRSSRKFY